MKTNTLTFDAALEEIKAIGYKEKGLIETAEKTANIINSLVKARTRQKMTQRELAEKCGVKQSTIGRMETLQVIPRLDTVLRVANCLGVDIQVEEEVVESSAAKVYQFPGTFYSDDGYNFPAVACDYPRLKTVVGGC